MKSILLIVAFVAAAVAEPEAEADPLLVYRSGLYNTGLYNPYRAGFYNRAIYPYSNTFGYRTLYKREAEAEPEAEAEADPLLVYRSGLYNRGLYQPYTGFYNRAVYPYSNTFGYRTLYKREAEAEADPATVITNGLFHTNLANVQKGIHNQYLAGTVNGLYNTYRATPAVYHYPSTVYSHIYKREAEAEAEADPLLVYRSGLYNRGLYQPYAGFYNRAAYPYYNRYFY